MRADVFYSRAAENKKTPLGRAYRKGNRFARATDVLATGRRKMDGAQHSGASLYDAFRVAMIDYLTVEVAACGWSPNCLNAILPRSALDASRN